METTKAVIRQECIECQGGREYGAPEQHEFRCRRYVAPFASAVRKFDTGATRDTDAGKLAYSRALSPQALKCFVEYMHECRHLPDGTLRDPDNWKRGIPLEAFMDSGLRHVMDWWHLHNNLPVTDRKTGEPITTKTALCAVLFNAMGYLHEILVAEEKEKAKQ